MASSAPNSSVKIRAGSVPSAVSASRMPVMNDGRPADVGGRRGGRDAQRGEPLPGDPAARRRARGGVRPAWPRCRRCAHGRAAGRRAGRAPRRRTGCSSGPRAPYSHHTSRSLPAAASWCSMDSTGVTPMPGGDQQHRAGAVVEGELAARRGHLQQRAGLQVLVQPAAGHAVRLPLDADPVGAGVRRRRQRIAAHRDRLGGAGDPQGQVLPGPRGRQRGAVAGRQVDRAHRRVLMHDLGDPQCPERGPGRPRFRRRGGEHVAERALPARAERADPQRGAQLAGVGAGQVQQRVGVGHRQRFWPGGDLDDRVAGLDASLGDDPQVEAGPVMRRPAARAAAARPPACPPGSRSPAAG